MGKVIHIVLIRFSSLGDVVLTTSVISALKFLMGENVFISYLTSEFFTPILQKHRDLDALHSISRQRGLPGFKELFLQVKKIHQERPIDLLIDLHGSLRSLFIRLLFPQLPRIAIDKRTVERTLLTWFKIDFLSRQFSYSPRFPHWGEPLLRRNIEDLLPLLGWNGEWKDLSLFINSKRNDQLSSCSLTYCGPFDDVDLFSSLQITPLKDRPFLSVVPTASFAGKRWPIERFKELLQLFLSHPRFTNWGVIVLAGKGDDFCSGLNNLKEHFPERFYNLQGKTSLLESLFILKRSQICLGNDTGLPHLAESVGTPSLFILGPTGEEFGFYPHLKDSRVVSVSLWCRPCTTNGEGNCIRSQRYCLLNITPEQVFENLLIMQKEQL